MTTTPGTTRTDTKHHFLAGLADQGGYAHDFARSGRAQEAAEHLQAIEGLITAYRAAIDTTDTLPEWLYRRFARYRRNAPAWSDLTEDDQAFWAHEAAAVRRAVARGGFKDGGE